MTSISFVADNFIAWNFVMRYFAERKLCRAEVSPSLWFLRADISQHRKCAEGETSHRWNFLARITCCEEISPEFILSRNNYISYCILYKLKNAQSYRNSNYILIYRKFMHVQLSYNVLSGNYSDIWIINTLLRLIRCLCFNKNELLW